ncbi:MAG TPA: HEAT repeat domain-containing protein [Anaeromyxobacter sp.]|nr:HEAT repeat domain-containing protein [Anaeromyxobacter sp.]
MSEEPRSPRALARHADEETRYRAIRELDPDDAGDRQVLLERLGDASWRVRSAAAERVGSGADPRPVLPALLDLLAGGATVGARDAAARALARAGGAAVAPLVERLGGPDPDLRQAAAAVLAAIADRRAAPALTARLADPDPNVRAAAADALGKIGGREAVEALRAAVDSDDATLRLSALEALAQLGASLPPAQLARVLEDRALRRPAYRLLGASDDPGAIPLLARGLRDPSRSVREAALAALGQQRTRQGAGALAALLDALRAAARDDPGVADAWAEALASEDPRVAAGALAAVAAAGEARHVAAMLRLAEDERHRALVEEALEGLAPGPELRAALADSLPSLGLLARLTALAALARLGSPASFESLVREASDPEAYAQAEAIAALGRLVDVRGVAPLAGLLGDDAPRAAGLASSALVRIAQAGAGGRAAVVAALRDRAGAAPSAALYRAIGATGDAEDLALLRAALAAEAATHRASAAAAIGALARRGVAPGAIPELAAALADPAPAVRSSAARALADAVRAARERRAGEAPPAEVLARLRAALEDADPGVRAAAAEALGVAGRAGDARALAALAGSADATPQVAVAALHALAALGGAPGDVVARAARHADPEVAKEAVLAAARVPGPDGERVIRDAAASPRWDVRQAAARALAERGDRALAAEAARAAAADPDPLVARAFADAARALGAE